MLAASKILETIPSLELQYNNIVEEFRMIEEKRDEKILERKRLESIIANEKLHVSIATKAITTAYKKHYSPLSKLEELQD